MKKLLFSTALPALAKSGVATFRQTGNILFLAAIAACLFMPLSSRAQVLEADGMTCEIRVVDSQLKVVLSGEGREPFIDGAYQWWVDVNGRQYKQCSELTASRSGKERILVSGSMGPLQITQTWTGSSKSGFIEEQITLTNTSAEPVELKDIRTGVVKAMDPDRSSLRLYAVPFMRDADGSDHQYSMPDLAALADRTRLSSEGWILNDGQAGLLVLKYNNESVEKSALTVLRNNKSIILGGCAYTLKQEPVQAHRIEAGASFSFGATVYRFFDGNWPEGFRHFKNYVNGKGHGLHPGYSPQVQWNSLYDLGSGHWPREKMLEQAGYAREVGCTRLYLDPGWQTLLGSGKWDEKRLGSQREVVKLLKEEYGLELGLWTACNVMSSWTLWEGMGMHTLPNVSEEMAVSLEVPLIRDDRQNLCLGLMVTAKASSALSDGSNPRHQVDHLHDGWYGNPNSWIAKRNPAWIEIDLSKSETISRVILGNDRTGTYKDRGLSSVRILVANEYSLDSSAENWKEVFSSDEVDPVELVAEFDPVQARWIRAELEGKSSNPVRVDEIEIYPPQAVTEEDLLKVEINHKRGPSPVAGGSGYRQDKICIAHKDFIAGRRKQLLETSAAGLDFWMFDFHGWQGPCYAEDHGHSVPSTTAEHIDALYSVSREIRERFPHIRIEMHDAIRPWGKRYLPGYFRQGLDGGDYDENWGFEFMWNTIEDIRSGKALALYYYNLAYDVPMYCHINMRADNDHAISFWWSASTLRHLGIGNRYDGWPAHPHGALEETDMDKRFELYKQQMVTYNRLADYFKQGEFKGIDGDPSLHLHTLKDVPGGVLLVFNLTDQPVKRTVGVPAEAIYTTPGRKVKSNLSEAHWEGNNFTFEVELEPWEPRLILLDEAYQP